MPGREGHGRRTWESWSLWSECDAKGELGLQTEFEGDLYTKLTTGMSGMRLSRNKWATGSPRRAVFVRVGVRATKRKTGRVRDPLGVQG